MNKPTFVTRINNTLYNCWMEKRGIICESHKGILIIDLKTFLYNFDAKKIDLEKKELVKALIYGVKNDI